MKNQTLANECELPSRDMRAGRIQSEESALAKRLRETIGEESVVAFGRRCGIVESTLRKYFSGTLPNSENLVAMADTGNVNIEWLATGRGPKLRGALHIASPPAPTPPQPVLDVPRLGWAIAAVEEGLRDSSRYIPPELRAKLIESAYHLLGDMEAADKVAGPAIDRARKKVTDFIKLTA